MRISEGQWQNSKPPQCIRLRLSAGSGSAFEYSSPPVDASWSGGMHGFDVSLLPE